MKSTVALWICAVCLVILTLLQIEERVALWVVSYKFEHGQYDLPTLNKADMDRMYREMGGTELPAYRPQGSKHSSEWGR